MAPFLEKGYKGLQKVTNPGTAQNGMDQLTIRSSDLILLHAKFN